MYKSLDSLYIHVSFFIHLSCVLEVLFELFVAKDLLQLFGSKPYRLFEALGLDGQTSLSLPNVVSVLSIRMEFRRHGWRLRKLIPWGKKSDIPWENPGRVAMVGSPWRSEVILGSFYVHLGLLSRKTNGDLEAIENVTLKNPQKGNRSIYEESQKTR